MIKLHLLYALAWLSFGVGHSLLASEGVKRRLEPALGAFYRLSYNLFAALHIGAVMAFGAFLFGDATPLAKPEWVARALQAAYVTGWFVLFYGLSAYDLGLFAGTRQIRDRVRGIEGPTEEPFHYKGPLCYIRHPIYLGAVLILVGRVATTLDLATAFWGCLYLLIGAAFEERKLLRLYGEAYADYRNRVPALIPWKGRAI